MCPCREPSLNLPATDVADAARSARGRFPAEFLSLGDGGPNTIDNTFATVPGPDYDPELHVLDAEWYFADSSIPAIARAIRGESVCLIGTPKLANEIAMLVDDVVLVDKNPLIKKRFPLLHGRVQIESADVLDVELKSSFNSVVLDPPWYFPEFWLWLDLASRAVGGAGRLIMPLLGEGTRPSARKERAELLSALSTGGRVVVIPTVVEYETPLFERRALAATGIRLNRPWRLADLVVADLDHPLTLPAQHDDLRQSPADSGWQTFVVGSQVVKLRKTRPGRAGLIAPVQGVKDYAFDTVSRRDDRWSSIDLWTSRNRVAVVLDHPGVSSAIRSLEGPSETLPERVTALRSRTGPDVEMLLSVLEVDR